MRYVTDIARIDLSTSVEMTGVGVGIVVGLAERDQ